MLKTAPPNELFPVKIRTKVGYESDARNFLEGRKIPYEPCSRFQEFKAVLSTSHFRDFLVDGHFYLHSVNGIPETICSFPV